jgi:hypothetical protein
VTLEEVQAAGFDRSYQLDEEDAVKVLCSGCDALVINGCPCHERGCPNKVVEPAFDELWDDPTTDEDDEDDE